MLLNPSIPSSWTIVITASLFFSKLRQVPIFSLKDHDEFGDQAATLVEKWKQIAKKSGVMSRKEKRSHMVQAQKEINEEIP